METGNRPRPPTVRVDPDDYQIRVSDRARRLRIDVSARRGVVVVVPAGTPDAVVHAFVAAKRAWVSRARERIALDARAFDRPDEGVPQALALRALGCDLAVDTVADGRPGVRRHGDRVRVSGAADESTARSLMTQWLKRVARAHLPVRLHELADGHGLVYRRVTVRGQRTRWGSCSGRGTISLNFKLLFLPPALVDHVLLHELAHTRHLDHSHRFWRLLARLDPDWRAHHAELARAAQWLPAWVELDERAGAPGAGRAEPRMDTDEHG